MCISPSSPAFEEAMSDLVNCGLAVEAGEADLSVLLRYADALWAVRDTRAVIAVIDRALAMDPSTAELSRMYAQRAICELQNGSLEQALEDVCASLEAEPRAHPYILRAMIQRHLGNLPEAIADAMESVRLDPHDWEGRSWRGMILFEAGRYAEAIDDFTTVIDTGECEKYASELHLERARSYLALGDPARAEDDCTTSIDLDYHEQAHWPFIVPTRVRQAHFAYRIRAEARLALGKNNLALGDCFFSAVLAPADPAVYELRARVYHAVGNLPEAMLDMIRAAQCPAPEGASEVGGAATSQPALAMSGD